jgi:hypothetical protein
MFPGMSPFSQLQPFAQGMGGVNPIISQLVSSQGAGPLASLLGQQGWGQIAHPLVVAHIAANYPALLPLITQQAGYGQVPYTIQSLLQSQPGSMGSPFQQLGGPFGAGIGQQTHPLPTILGLLGQQGYGQQFGGGIGQGHPLLTILSLAAQQRGPQGFGQQLGGFGQPTSPLSVILSLMGQQGAQPGLGQQGVDPFTVAQQLSQWTQSQLPIRPLVSPQQYDPFQASSLTSFIGGQTIDPIASFTQACLPSSFAISPIHQALKSQAVAPWAVSAAIPALASPIVPLASPIVPLTSPIVPLASPIAPLVGSITPMMQSVAAPYIC